MSTRKLFRELPPHGAVEKREIHRRLARECCGAVGCVVDGQDTDDSYYIAYG